jgi:hypothetical protein
MRLANATTRRRHAMTETAARIDPASVEALLDELDGSA